MWHTVCRCPQTSGSSSSSSSSSSSNVSKWRFIWPLCSLEDSSIHCGSRLKGLEQNGLCGVLETSGVFRRHLFLKIHDTCPRECELTSGQKWLMKSTKTIQNSDCVCALSEVINTINRAVMAEWLRRWTRNPMGFPRAGSNPAHSGNVISFNHSDQ